MTVSQIIFLIAGLVTLVAAILVVTVRSMVHAALWLILALAGIAVLFVLLNAPFLAVVQVAVYIDAIAVLIIIVVMLTRRAMDETGRQVTRTWWAAAIVALLFFTGLAATFALLPVLTGGAPAEYLSGDALLGELGASLVRVDQYLLPFEVASILLLAALIGSIVIAWPRQGSDAKGGER